MVAENPTIPTRVQLAAVLKESCQRAVKKGPFTPEERRWLKIQTKLGIPRKAAEQVLFIKRPSS